MWILFWVFVAIAAVGMVLMLIMALTGGFLDLGVDISPDIDVGDFSADFEPGGSPTPLSLPVFLFTLSMIGAIGAILTFFGVHWLLTVSIAVGGAIICAVIAFLIMSKVLTAVTSNAVENVDRLKGVPGIVTIPISAGQEGQVTFSSDKTGMFTVGAISNEELSNGTSVVVTQVLGDIVKVKKKGSKGKGKKKGGEKKRK